jgi:arsenite methyltransferase
MSSYNLFQRRLLSVAAKTRRTMQFAEVTRGVETLGKPAYGMASPVLVLGNVARIDPAALGPDTELLIAAADENKWREMAEALEARGLRGARRLSAEPHNLRLDLSRAAERWNAAPPASYHAAMKLIQDNIQAADATPLVGDQSIASIYCNGFSDLLDDSQRLEVLRESHRVLRKGGVLRCAVDLYDELDGNGLLAERSFTAALESVGFYGMRIVERSDMPKSISDGRELRSYVLDAFRGKEGPCLDCGQSVIYRGPWKKVVDDDGHEFERDVRAAVCEKTFRIMTSAPYAGELIPVEPYVAVPIANAPLFDCRSKIRTPAETKGVSAPACEPNSGCC